MGFNPFDNLQKAMMGVITRQFGYDAQWLSAPEGGNVVAQARVLFKSPTTLKYSTIDEQDFDYERTIMEYFASDFVGLKESADTPENDTTISIAGILYFVRKVTAKYDGKTLIALLEPR